MSVKLSKEVLESQTAGEVLSAFFSIAPKITMISLVAFLTAVLAFNFFFNPNLISDVIAAYILAFSLLIGLFTLFRSVHLFVEDKLFNVLYKNPKDVKIFDEAVQFLWKKHSKTLSLQDRWDGCYHNFVVTIRLCIIQWIFTLIGFTIIAISAE